MLTYYICLEWEIAADRSLHPSTSGLLRQSSVPKPSEIAPQLRYFSFTDIRIPDFDLFSAEKVTVTADEPVRITMPMEKGDDGILSREAMALLTILHRRFEPKRQQILSNRKLRQARLDAGERPNFLVSTKKDIRQSDWRIRGKGMICTRFYRHSHHFFRNT